MMRWQNNDLFSRYSSDKRFFSIVADYSWIKTANAFHSAC